VIEMASASGLHLLRPEQRNPLNTTTFGTGELIRAAIEAGAGKIILGIGGSATVDGGLGCAQACGMRIWAGEENREVSSPATGADLLAMRSVTRPVVAEGVELLVACDVRNPLTGPEGAACVYGPQKGATPAVVLALDQALERLARLAEAEGLAKYPGAGAAGGLGFAMLALFGARLRPGIELIIDAVDLRRRLAGADLCITAEGRFDSSSLAGKTPVGVARLCHELGVPCIALAGSVELPDGTNLPAGIKTVHGIREASMALEDSLRQAPRLLRQATGNVLRLFLSRP
jgi:glycerate kinase